MNARPSTGAGAHGVHAQPYMSMRAHACMNDDTHRHMRKYVNAHTHKITCQTHEHTLEHTRTRQAAEERGCIACSLCSRLGHRVQKDEFEPKKVRSWWRCVRHAALKPSPEGARGR